ncbi:hypothetical protein EST38_g4230 [Candolleomyces aberdarensis]|uniref:Uncharacterized protein n=1 Tax=Candolleomyces aberdarensis TaxID=2316362 RepID=A0A4Q2DNM4_9AGAR|nr:hypothetical protein EST38_g4230 [Candolleomyces aberdarensis]
MPTQAPNVEMVSSIIASARLPPAPDQLQAAESSQNIRHNDLDIPVSKRKGTRSRRMPARYRQDVLPQPPPPVETGDVLYNPDQGTSTLGDGLIEATGMPTSAPTLPHPLSVYTSRRNSFGVMREYSIRLNSTINHDPDGLITLHDLTDIPLPSPRNVSRNINPYGPFSNLSSFLMADWYWNSNNKSYLDFQKLISILKRPNFSLEDATQVNWAATFKALGANKEDLPDDAGSWIEDDGWKTTQISIDVPFHSRMKNSGMEKYTVGNFSGIDA